MRFKDHIEIGLLVGGIAGVVFGVSILTDKDSLLKKLLKLFSSVLICGAIGGIASCLPDILEPASNPNHRKILHSYLTLGFSAGMLVESKNPLIKTAAAGYISHLILDAFTPRGLPLV